MTAMQDLGTHYAEGRIDLTEFNDRTAKVAEARTLGQLRPLFDDLPGGLPLKVEETSIVPINTAPAPVTSSSAELELHDLKRRGNRIHQLDVIFQVVGFAVFFIGMALGWGYFWLAILASGGASILTRTVLNFDDSEEKTFNALQKKEAKEKQQRLLQVQERMKELGA